MKNWKDKSKHGWVQDSGNSERWVLTGKGGETGDRQGSHGREGSPTPKQTRTDHMSKSERDS